MNRAVIIAPIAALAVAVALVQCRADQRSALSDNPSDSSSADYAPEALEMTECLETSESGGGG